MIFAFFLSVNSFFYHDLYTVIETGEVFCDDFYMSRLEQFKSRPHNYKIWGLFVCIPITAKESSPVDQTDAERIISLTDVATTKLEGVELAEMFDSAIASSPLFIPVDVEVMPPPRRLSLGDDDDHDDDHDHDKPRPPTPPPSDADDGEPEIEAEFRQNLSHLMGRDADLDEEADGGNIRLSIIVEENLDSPVVGSVSWRAARNYRPDGQLSKTSRCKDAYDITAAVDSVHFITDDEKFSIFSPQVVQFIWKRDSIVTSVCFITSSKQTYIRFTHKHVRTAPESLRQTLIVSRTASLLSFIGLICSGKIMYEEGEETKPG